LGRAQRCGGGQRGAPTGPAENANPRRRARPPAAAGL